TMEITPEILERFEIPPGSVLSYTDELTALPNRRFLRRILDKFVSSERPFSLLFMDLDNFKEVNDTAGHEEGDRLLRRLSDLLRNTLRKRDMVVRYGGDEFIVLTSGGDGKTGMLVAEKIISAVREKLGPRWGVSASIGIASYPGQAERPSDLISMADNAMYAAKSSGKSCWRVSSSQKEEIFWHEDVFVARNRELERAGEALDSGDENCLVLISGATGTGKTSLLGALASAEADSRIIRVRCRPEFSGVPWAALVSSVRRHMGELPKPELPEIWKSLLGRLMPDVFGESDIRTSSMDKLALFDAFSSLLSSWTPLFLIIDDVQWLDPETAGFISYALQNGVKGGLRVAAAISEKGGGSSSGTGGIFRGTDRCVEIQLEPLSRFQTTELVKARLGVVLGVEDFAEHVYRYSGGNPLFACEYVRNQLNSGMLRVEEGRLMPFSASDEVPDRIRTIVGKTLKLLDGDSRMVVQYASAMRREPIELDLLADISERSLGEVLNALDEGLRHGMLRTASEDTMSFHFTNQAFREEIRRRTGANIRSRTHNAVAERRLEQEDYLSAGYHMEMAERKLEALEVYRKGASSYLHQGLPRAAVECLEKADGLSLSLSDDEFSKEELWKLKSDLFNAYRLVGEWDRTREIALQHADLSMELGKPRVAFSSRLLAADCKRMWGDYQGSFEELEELDGKLEGTHSADNEIRKADNLSRLGRTDEALQALDKAGAIIDSLDQDEYRCNVDYVHQRLIVSISMEDFQSAPEYASRLLEYAEKKPDDPWWYFYDVAESYMISGRPETAREVFRKCLERASSMAALHGQLVTRPEMADACFYCMDFPAAVKLLDEAEELAEKFSEVKVLDDSSLIRVKLAMEHGRTDYAGRLLDDLLCRQPNNPAVAVVNSMYLQQLGNLKDALSEIERSLKLLNGGSMTSIIDTSVIFTMDEMKLLQRWLAALTEGEDWSSVFRELEPDLDARAAFRGVYMLADWLAERDREQEADSLIEEAVGKDEWKEMKLFRFRCLGIKSRWDTGTLEDAERMINEDIE
ncbi:MAG: diguanylate cyclase, partial [Candidatus Aegiribacteria sp.]|nr:diguanylate cyclase [Candidatus Aegiribacteria sp.]MBD3295438.1 diguanylate cyclase [Candidatus Fermentibacteria bacterium]